MAMLSGLATPLQGLKFKSGIRGSVKPESVVNIYDSVTYAIGYRIVSTRELAGCVRGDHCIRTQKLREFELGFNQPLLSRFTEPFHCVRTYLGCLHCEPCRILPRICIMLPRLVLDHIEPVPLGYLSAEVESCGKLILRRGETILCR